MYRFGKTPALFGVIIIAIAAGVWLAGHPRDSASPAATSPASSKMVGKSALSHGGLPRENDAISPDRAPAPFTVGERVIVDPSVARFQVQPAQRTAALAPGKKMVITAIKTSGPDRPERFYEVRSSGGWTGWVPESALTRDTADTEGGAP